MILQCAVCLKQPSELGEYVDAALGAGITPDEYVRSEEGTFNPDNGLFVCDADYIAIGMPSNPSPGKNWKPNGFIDGGRRG